MGLHIVIGFSSASKEAEPKPVYLGYSASDAQRAKDVDTTSARFEEFHHATGLRKNNPRYVTPTAEAPVAKVENHPRRHK